MSQNEWHIMRDACFQMDSYCSAGFVGKTWESQSLWRRWVCPSWLAFFFFAWDWECWWWGRSLHNKKPSWPTWSCSTLGRFLPCPALQPSSCLRLMSRPLQGTPSRRAKKRPHVASAHQSLTRTHSTRGITLPSCITWGTTFTPELSRVTSPIRP